HGYLRPRPRRARGRGGRPARSRRAIRIAVPRVPRHVPRRERRPRGARCAAAVHELPRAGDRPPALVPGARRRHAPRAPALRPGHGRADPLRPRRAARPARGCGMSWAIWITGIPGSGKTVIARAAEDQLRASGVPVRRLEMDEIRKILTPEPRYTDREREVVYRAIVYMATLLTEADMPVIIDATAHRRAWRTLARQSIDRFAEVQ